MSAAESLSDAGYTAAGQTFLRQGDVVQILMACGLWFSISAEDFERVGQFRWSAKRNRKLPNKIYVQRNVREPGSGRNGPKKTIALHRFIMGVTDPDVWVDHRHGTPLDNTRGNLRITDARGNATNVTSSKRQKLGGFKGVTWNKRAKKWQVSICAGPPRPNGKRKQLYLGIYTDPLEASHVYDAAAVRYFGEFANINHPENLPDLIALTGAIAEHAERGAVADLLATNSGDGGSK